MLAYGSTALAIYNEDFMKPAVQNGGNTPIRPVMQETRERDGKNQLERNEGFSE